MDLNISLWERVTNDTYSFFELFKRVRWLHIMLFMKGKWKFLLLRDNASCCQIKVYGFLHLSLFMLLCITCTLPEVIYRCSIKTLCDKMLWSTTSVGDNGLLDDADMISIVDFWCWYYIYTKYSGLISFNRQINDIILDAI